MAIMPVPRTFSSTVIGGGFSRGGAMRPPPAVAEATWPMMAPLHPAAISLFAQCSVMVFVPSSSA
jgi:hypothetical protein